MPKIRLKPKEELFCQYYARSGQAFGNARMAYALAFGKDWENEKQKNVCDVLSQRLLRKVLIYSRCEKLMRERISDEIVDNELEWVAKQRDQLHPKVSAISEINKVRGRITEKHKHQFERISDEALAEEIAKRVAGALGDDGGTGNKTDGK